uniref:Uncharacterized protein n=1 Tax=Stegastes partitus TaxID=144197 RepID=A0A3B4YX98_9TELE
MLCLRLCVCSQVKSVINLLFAAYTGDVSALRRFALSSMDMEQRDYDSRTALHVAAAEGGGTHRWTKRCTSATTTSSPSCRTTKTNTALLPPPTTRRALRAAWTACCRAAGCAFVE